jgi:ATP-binding cassette subfamily B (MDR/TAP) protein 1
MANLTFFCSMYRLGKSSTIGLLQRWYDVDGGRVCLDEHNIKTFTLDNLRSHMALVSQEPVVFNISIKDNIQRGGLSEEPMALNEVEEACKLANIHDFIASLPDGYDTRVGNKGSKSVLTPQMV